MIEVEQNKPINILDLTRTRMENKNKNSVFKENPLRLTKPYTTRVTTHPQEQKMAALNSLVYRLLTLPLETDDYKELSIIIQVAIANGYTTETKDNFTQKTKQRKQIQNKHQMEDKTKTCIN